VAGSETPRKFSRRTSHFSRQLFFPAHDKVHRPMRGPRFHSKLSDDAAQLNASIDFDQRLLPFDVEGSKAHARMLAAQGIVTAADAEAIARGLDQVVDEWRQGKLTLDPQLEDVHMNVEVRLTEIIGDAGARLHTARSR